MKFPAVLWDMDGTLIDSEPLHFTALIQVLGELGLAWPEDLQQQLVGRSAHAVHALLVEGLGLTLDYPQFTRRKYAAYLSGASTLQARAPAVALYRQLAALGCPQVIVSNSDRMLVEANIQALGLNQVDLLSVTRNDVRHGKPDAEPYLRAAWLVGVEPGRCAVVEDSPTGVAAGVAAGMTVFALPEAETAGMQFPDTVISVTCAEQLAQLLGVQIDGRQAWSQ